MAKKKKIEQPEPIEQKATESEVLSFEKNYASDSDVCERFLAQISNPMTQARNNRLSLEDQWIDDIRSWSCRLDDLGYVGRSNVYVPELHNQVESSIEKSLAALFPSPDAIHAVGVNGTPQEKADKIKHAVQYELEEKNNLMVLHEEFDRQKILLGTSVYKAEFRKEFLDVYSRDKAGKPYKTSVPKAHGVYWNVVDLFHWYIYPETATLKDYKIIFEDMFVDRSTIEDNELYKNVDSVQAISTDLKHQWSDAEQLEIVDLATAASSRPDSVFLTEVYCDFEIKKGKKVPVKAILANLNTVIRLTRNPYWDQDHPYEAEGYTKRPGKIFYSLSMPDKIRSQQYMMNDITNHTMDSLTYVLNPITIVDPALAGDIGSMKMHPGAKWLGSPEGIRPMQFPDLTPSGLRAMQEIRGQIAQFSDNSPGIAPQLQGKSRSATQSTIVQNAVSQRQRVQATSEEQNVLIPMCKKTHVYLQQFMDVNWQIKYQGPDNGEWIVEDVKPLDLVGEVNFIWRGASQQERTAVRSQQLLGFMQQALQMSAIQPGEVDLPLLFKKVAREAFGLTDMDEMFKSLKDKKTVPQEVENIALLQNNYVPVHTGDDDDEHIRKLDLLLEDKDLTDDQLIRIQEHKELHAQQKAAKLELSQIKARMDALKQFGGEAEGPDGREGPAVPSPMEGNQAQQASTPESLMTGAKGVNPGV